MDAQTYIQNLEKNIMLGAGRWVADFRESFRNFPLGSLTFDLFIRGSTRPKGFLLSRLFAYFAMPDYRVAFYAKHTPDDGFNLSSLCKAIRKHSEKRNIKWSWLTLFRSSPFPESLIKRVEGFKEENIGIALVNTEEQEIDTSPSILGRKVVPLVRAFR